MFKLSNTLHIAQIILDSRPLSEFTLWGNSTSLVQTTNSDHFASRTQGEQTFLKEIFPNENITKFLTKSSFRKMNCLNCPISTPHTKDKCPYAKCKICGKSGHSKKNCPEAFAIDHDDKESDAKANDENSTPKKRLTKRQSTYLFICYTLAKLNTKADWMRSHIQSI